MLPSFILERPGSVAEAVRLLAEDSVGYCGGTELLLAMKMGLLRPSRLVDLKGLPELSRIEAADGELRIGAAVTHDAVARSPLVAEYAPFLAGVESRVGNARVRAQGSIGGNLCFCEPRSDVTSALCALDGQVELLSGDGGTRLLPMGEFLLGAYWTAREDNELLIRVRIPLPAPDGVYMKYQTSERPVVGIAAVREPAGEGLRLVVGAVTDTPVRYDVPAIGPVDVDGIVGGLEFTADLGGSEEYKRHVTAVYINRALMALDTL
ncbi:MAG: Molybdopterin dehydrogenase, FAD-binding [Actinomycetia bacterium]|nr:Molybdopterin dehydrogenase, FAD-binding [Actinomycetes bacterium]